MYTLRSVTDIAHFLDRGDTFKRMTVNADSIDVLFERKHTTNWTIASVFRAILETTKLLFTTFDWNAVKKLWPSTQTAVEKRTARIFTDTIPKIPTDDLRVLFECYDSQRLIAHLTNQMPHLLDCVKIIKSASKINYVIRSTLYQALYVLVGLKPTLALEPDSTGVAKNLIALMAPFFPHVRFIQKDDKFCFLVNEAPLAAFDPRVYVNDFDKEFHSISEAAVASFPSNNKHKADQLLSYVLGFGPTWEAYVLNPGMGSNKPYDNRHLSIFSDQHYLQLGKSLAKGKRYSETELIQNGKAYHARLSALREESNAQYNKKTVNERHQSSKDHNTKFRKIYDLCMDHVIDEVSFETDYIQASIRYREQLATALQNI